MKEKFQTLALKSMLRAEASRESIELNLDTTPEGIIAFVKYLIELVGYNKLDLGRASVINGCLQTILRTNESGIEAVKELEESTSHLAKTIRTTATVNRKSSA
jgi:hypothetical protein